MVPVVLAKLESKRWGPSRVWARGNEILNPADLSQVNLGEIQVNARTLATDSERRNQAIRRQTRRVLQESSTTSTATGQPGQRRRGND